MGFFKKEEPKQEKIAEISKENVQISKVQNTASMKRKNLSVCDVDTIEYVIKNFPSKSVDIQEGLLNLADILERTIDHIEDKSSEVVKEDRNFELSQNYRDTSISIYKMVQNIQDYVLWMKDEYDKNNKVSKDEDNKESEEKTTESRKDNTSNDDLEEDKKTEAEYAANEKYIERKESIAIYNDFTGKEPEAFILDNEVFEVDDWNDLLVRLAEILTKKYRENKHTNKTVKEFKVVDAKSTQNEFRNTAIEMLNEYKIDLDKLEVIEK